MGQGWPTSGFKAADTGQPEEEGHDSEDNPDPKNDQRPDTHRDLDL